MISTRVLSAIVVAALAPAASATDRFFLDSFAVSPNGRYRIDAKSPDNAGDHPRPFASNFTYTLTDTSSKKVIWERKQPMTRAKGSAYASSAEASPVQVFVNDDGLVAARLSWDSLLFLDRADGHKRAEAQVLQAFPQDEQDTFVSRTTAGPIWSQNSDWYFLQPPAHNGRAGAVYFVVRPYWNHRLIVDAATGKHVDLGTYHSATSLDALAAADDNVKQLLTAAMQDETRRALASLAAAPDSLKNDKDYSAYWQLSAALHTVGFLKVVAAESQLRVLEKGFGDASEERARLRAKVREALRSIGQAPTPGFGVRLYPLVDRGGFLMPDTSQPFTAHLPVEERTANATRIAAGMSTKELANLVGSPDAELYDGGRCYDYDIDAPAPYTLRVHFNQTAQTIMKVEKITPFAFLHDPARMRGY